MLYVEDAQGTHDVLQNLSAAVCRRIDEQGDIGDGQKLFIAGNFQKDNMGDQTVFADQMVCLVQNRHQQVSGRGVAAHQAVCVAGLDHLNGELHHVGAVVNRLEIIAAILQAKVLHHGLDPLVVADQNRFDKAVCFCLKKSFQNGLRISTGEGDAHPLAFGAGFRYDSFKLFCKFNTHGESLL